MIKYIIISLTSFAISFASVNIDNNFHDNELTKTVEISRISSPPIIDGLLHDAVWEPIPIISDFLQDEPNNMAMPTETTEVKIAYDEESIYVAVHLSDSVPDKISKHMARRDGWRKVMMSDWFSIEIDSYHDHQTAFEFLVNSMGTQFDERVFDDSFRNTEWNAIWESEISFDEDGWNVEMRIPFSTLRFSNDVEIVMGINLNRYIQRKNELVSWVVYPRAQSGIASKFGHLEGIHGLQDKNKKIMISPYTTQGIFNKNNYTLISRDQPQVNKENKTTWTKEFRPGLDFKYLITQDIVNDIALNPDYGQIEADPADINLSYFETYFVEKRPFFMENATLFDTPIEVFYSRRIGTNREYIMGNWQAQYNSIVKYAGKLTGKNKNGLSFGVITAVTNDTIPSWSEVNSNSNFLVGRLTQDLFRGNSYIGFLSTIYNDSKETDYVNSIDMLSYFWENQLVLDWQIINSQSDNVSHFADYNGAEEKSGNGFSLEVNYNPNTNIFYSFLDMEYFDKTLNINDVGYLYRNNLKKIQGEVGLYWPELDLPFHIIEGRLNLNFNKMNNLDNLVLNNSFGFNSSITFDNFSYLGAGLSYLNEYNDDLLLYDYYSQNPNKSDRLGPPIMIPNGTEINISMGSDPNKQHTINTNLLIWENDYEEGRSQSIIFGLSPTEHIDFSIEIRQVFSNEMYRWIEGYNKSQLEYIFAESDNESQKYIYEINYIYNRKASIQLYGEYYTNYNKYGQFYKYRPDSMDYESINVLDYYVSYDGSNWQGDLSYPLNPQNHVYHYTKDHIFNMNLVFNYQYAPGSNIYLVYSLYRDVVGSRMNNFIEFIKYVPAETDLAEVNFTQSLYLKMDYWFDF